MKSYFIKLSHKGNTVVSRFLVTNNKPMSNMRLRQPRFIYRSCELFPRTDETTKKSP